jgi:hypothetical protein
MDRWTGAFRSLAFHEVMAMKSRRTSRGAVALALLVPAVALGCGSSGATASGGGHGGAAPATSSTGAGGLGGTSTASGEGGALLGTGGGNSSHGAVVSLSISPAASTLLLPNGNPGVTSFQAIAHYADKTTAMVSNVSWSADGLAVGAIDGMGTFTATGAQGGVVTVTATSGKQTATAQLTVEVQINENPGGASGATQTALMGAKTPDMTVVWSYPYDQTVFPRGIGEPTLMWENGAATDVYLAHLTSPTYDLTVYFTAPTGDYDFDPGVWNQFLNSTSGVAELEVSRLSNGVATVIVDQHWTIAAGSMRGTIYYWAVNTGRVMRIQPGATMPDDFLGPSVTCPSCHTVSANGSHLLMNEGNWPDETSISYDLGANDNAYSGFYSNGGGASQWAQPGVSADGKVIVENFAPLRGNIGAATGAFDSTTASALMNTGLEGVQLWMPSFSPDDQLLSYVDSTTKDLHAYDWDEATQTASGDRMIIAAGADASTNVICFPTATPDHEWLVYQRSSALGSLGNPADLYFASVAQPGTEVPLDNLNGTNYPFAAGARDLHLNYEPTFAPVAAGGYFWVVFHSRRTFGNELTGPAYQGEGTGTKQLWVAAIDQSPTPGKDPSHPPFHLPGQALDTLNMRGYWALNPCKADGVGCATGTDCCGGYCDASGDGGQPVCKSTSGGGCSQDGDHCTATSDCCGAAQGVTCINSVCSVPAAN